MANPLSFTQGNNPRYPAPDVARGFMLLPIALASVGLWAAAVGSRLFETRIDGVLTLLRVCLVDQRAYPVFAVLFGFGLMTMVQRRRKQYVDLAVHGLVQQGHVQLAPQSGVSIAQLFDRDATRTARRLLVNRGLWLLLICAFHGLVFPGDIAGAYALVALLFASVIAKERYRRIIVIGTVLAVLLLGALAVLGAVAPELLTYASLPVVSLDYSPIGLVSHTMLWAKVIVAVTVASFVVLGVGVGAYLATTSIISRPDENRLVLRATAGGGLLAAFLGGLPYALVEAEMVSWKLQWWMLPLHQLSGFFGALGWLALLTLFAGALPMSGELRGFRWVLCALGRRSLSFYILQSVLFAVIFVPLSWYGARISELAGVVIACGAWGLALVMASVMERAQWQGPCEWLIRQAVMSTSRPVTSSVFPEQHSWVAPQVSALSPVPAVQGALPQEQLLQAHTAQELGRSAAVGAGNTASVNSVSANPADSAQLSEGKPFSMED